MPVPLCQRPNLFAKALQKRKKQTSVLIAAHETGTEVCNCSADLGACFLCILPIVKTYNYQSPALPMRIHKAQWAFPALAQSQVKWSIDYLPSSNCLLSL